MKKLFNRYTSDEKKNTMYTMLANIINKVVVMCTSMVITRILTKNEYGLWSYILNVFSYLSLMSGAGLSSGALQFGTENHGNSRAYVFFKYCLNVGLLVNVILVLVADIACIWIPFPIKGAKIYIMAIIPVLIIDYINELGYSILRSQNRIIEYSKALNINTFAIAAGTCAGSLWGVKGLVIGRFLATILTLLYLLYILHKDFIKIHTKEALLTEEKNGLWNYSIFVGISAAMNCIVYYLDITFIAAMLKDATKVGIYRVGAQIPIALQFIPNSIIIAVLPTIIYNRNNIKWMRAYLKKLYLEVFAFNLVICLLVFFLAPLLVTILSGKQYITAAPILQILTFGYLFSGTFRTLSVNILAAFRRVKYGLLISIVSCVADFAFNYLLIGRFDMFGAAYATVLVNIITAIISFVYIVYLLKKGNINEIY